MNEIDPKALPNRASSYAEKRKMEDLIYTHSTEIKPGLRSWNSGWNHERVAMEVAPDLNKDHARALCHLLRVRVIVPDERAARMGSTKEALEILAEHQQQIAALSETVNGLVVRAGKLECSG